MKFILSFILLLFPCFVYGSVVINEIAWMGTETSYSDEWIELYNNSESNISLDGWILKADDGSPEINLAGTIPTRGFYLLERTDDETIPGILADLIYAGVLGNSGENLKLYNASGNIIDEVVSNEEWLSGDNSTKQTMEKIGSDWQTSQNPGGTPKSGNSKLEEVEEDSFLPIPEEKTKPAEARPPQAAEDGPPQIEVVNYPGGIVFNEILPSPEGADAENEWIELYNQNDFVVDLSGWTIKDTVGSTKTYILNTKIPANGYLVLLRPETKITLNNAGDGLNLFNPNGEIIDSVDFGKASQNQSYSKSSSGWSWTTILTPNSKNIIAKNNEQRIIDNKQKLSEVGLQTESVEIGSQRIKLVDNVKKSSKSSPFLIAFVVALCSSIAFLMIKSNLKGLWY